MEAQIKFHTNIGFLRALNYDFLSYTPFICEKERTMKILLYYNGSDYARDVLASVKKHVHQVHAEVDVVSSLPGNVSPGHEMISRMKGRLLDMKAALEKENIPCRTHLLMKSLYAGVDVVRFAEENGTEEIIIGVEKRARIEKFIMGSVEQYVILNADCPVTII